MASETVSCRSESSGSICAISAVMQQSGATLWSLGSREEWPWETCWYVYLAQNPFVSKVKAEFFISVYCILHKLSILACTLGKYLLVVLQCWLEWQSNHKWDGIQPHRESRLHLCNMGRNAAIGSDLMVIGSEKTAHRTLLSHPLFGLKLNSEED